MNQAPPLPGPDQLTQPFWDAAREGHLVIQRCQDCQYYNHPPRRACDRCTSSALQFEPVSGNGTVWSFTVMYQASVAGFADKLPYVDALIQLDEQENLFLVSNLPGLSPAEVRIGQRVTAVFQPLTNEISLPQFAPAGER